MPSTRRSGRLSGVRKTYTIDPLASEESDANSAEGTTKPSRNKGKKPVHVPDESSGDEFHAEEDEEEEEDLDDEDEAFEGEEGDDRNDAEDEDDADEATFSGEHVPITNISRRRRPKTPKQSQSKPAKQRQADGTLALTGYETHSRGTWNPAEHVGKSVHVQVTFGLDERDILSVLYTRDRWGRGIDSTFPTRISLEEADKLRDYTYGPTFGAEPDGLKRERTTGWDWFYGDEPGKRLRTRQQLVKITETEARKTFLPRSRKGKHTVLIGPANDQMVFNLDQYDALNFGDAWGEAKGRKETQPKASDAAKKKRQGWILNIGQRVQCTAWAPNQAGLNQYLAVVVPVTKEQKELYPDPLKDYVAPAFRESASYPCAIQLWAFKADKGGKLTKSIDMTFKPRLRSVLGTNWGDLRRIVWCHIPREQRDEDEEDVLRNVGLLAGVWSDGYVRVIDVKISRDPNTTDFHRIDAPLFEAKPPSSVCTCVTWLSSSDIAVGCANGFVAVYSIAPPSAPGERSSPSPYFYHPIHSTYVLNIASAYPTHPQIVATTSMDGETRLSSLIDFEKDKADTNRMRVGSPHLTYSPWLHSFVSSDDNDFVRLLTARRFFTTLAVARLSSTVSALATSSPWHPSILVGSTGGTVVATNPLRRLLHSKEKQWQQTWFSHTWVRGADCTGCGTSRFYDGYRAESISLLRNMTGDRKLINGTVVVTIFEEETHVTTLSWNPNQACAGWAAAGLGCGLIRVEDLAT